jgi:hypothetical protein
MRIVGSLIVIGLSILAVVGRRRVVALDAEIYERLTGSRRSSGYQRQFEAAVTAMCLAIVAICVIHIFGIA